MSKHDNVSRRSFLKYACFTGGTAFISANTTAAQFCPNFDFNGVKMCEAGINSHIADQTINSPQFRSQWCWAACISMIFDYYDHPVAQSRIVRRIFGSSMVDIPAMPHQILQALNISWEDDNGDRFYPEGAQIMTPDRNRNNILASQLLSQDTPIIIGSLGHATVLTAMSWAEDVYGRYIINSLTVRDPLRGRRTYLPQEAGFSHFMAVVRV
jgi:hypothetical protein